MLRLTLLACGGFYVGQLKNSKPNARNIVGYPIHGVSFLIGGSLMQSKWRIFADCEVHTLWGASLPALISCCFLTESWVSVTWNHLGSKCIAFPTLSPWFKIQPGSPNKVSLPSYFLLPSSQFHFLLWAPQQSRVSYHLGSHLFPMFCPPPTGNVSSPRAESDSTYIPST